MKKIKHLDFIFIVFLLFFAILHFFSWAENPPDVDPINFTVALEHYDVSTDRPHPPGYPLYVALGKYAAGFIGALHAYQLINLIMLIFAGLSIYFGSKKLGFELLGFCTVLILLTHPMVLSATLIAETYFSDALFGCLIVALIVLARDKYIVQLIGLISLFFLLGLFRAVSCFELIPLALSCMWICTDEKRFSKTAIALVGILIAVTIAYLFTVYLAGGYLIYSQAVARVMGAAFSSSSVFAGASISNHFSMLIKLIFWLSIISFPAILVICIILKENQFKQLMTPESLKVVVAFLSWILPPLAVFTLFYFLKPTYLLIILVPIVAAFNIGIFFIFKNKHYLYGLLVAFSIVVLQLSFFYSDIKSMPKPFYRLTHAYIMQKDFLWAELKSLLKKHNSDKTLLIWDPDYDLPIYAMRLIDWDGVVALTDHKDIENLESVHIKDILVSEVDPQTMQWSNTKKISEIDSIDHVLILNFNQNVLDYKKLKF